MWLVTLSRAQPDSEYAISWSLQFRSRLRVIRFAQEMASLFCRCCCTGWCISVYRVGPFEWPSDWSKPLCAWLCVVNVTPTSPVGAPNKTGGTRVWGNFRLLQEVHGVRHCPFWAAKLDSPQLVANYRRLWDQNWSTEQSLHEFWQAGRRVGCLAFSPDGRSMVMHFGAQDTFSQEYVFERGDRLYLIAFASVSSLSFEFASLSEAVRSMVNLAKFTSPLQQLMSKPMDRFINVLNLL